MSCIYFLRCASLVPNIAWKPSEDVANQFVYVLAAEEAYPNTLYPNAHIRVE